MEDKLPYWKFEQSVEIFPEFYICPGLSCLLPPPRMPPALLRNPGSGLGSRKQFPSQFAYLRPVKYFSLKPMALRCSVMTRWVQGDKTGRDEITAQPRSPSPQQTSISCQLWLSLREIRKLPSSPGRKEKF
jgi:hypothetical protein